MRSSFWNIVCISNFTCIGVFSDIFTIHYSWQKFWKYTIYKLPPFHVDLNQNKATWRGIIKKTTYHLSLHWKIYSHLPKKKENNSFVKFRANWNIDINLKNIQSYVTTYSNKSVYVYKINSYRTEQDEMSWIMTATYFLQHLPVKF